MTFQGGTPRRFVLTVQHVELSGCQQSRMSETIPLSVVGTQEPADQRARRADARANRARILEAAAQLSAEQGIAALTMEDVVSAAGVGKGTLYRHFGSKGELALALLDEHFASFQNQVLAQLRQMNAGGDAYLLQLIRFLDEFVAFIELHLPLFCEIQREGIQNVGENMAPYVWLCLTVRGLLVAATRAGELPAHLDDEYLADALLAPVSAHFYRFLREQRGFAPARIRAGMRQMVLGLATNDAGRAR